MALLFKSEADRAEWWRDEFARQVPDLEFRLWPEVGDPAEIEFALVWQPEPGDLKRYPNLAAIFSLGAGVDHILRDPDLPPGVPITRVVAENMTQRMTLFVVGHVLRHHLAQPAYDAQKAARRWQEIFIPHPADRRVGVLGLGVLGGDAARALAGLGFDTAGWSRTAKDIPGVTVFHGDTGFRPFLNRTEILVCLLPLTPETTGILNAGTFSQLPDGATLINVARGGHQVEDDILAALDTGQLGGATLDVFQTEPLPPEHPFWRHPKVTVTPHIASITDPTGVVAQIVENIRRRRAGEPLLNQVDATRGY